MNRNSSDPNDQLTADKAFVAISLFNILSFPLTVLPMMIAAVVQVGDIIVKLAIDSIPKTNHGN